VRNLIGLCATLALALSPAGALAAPKDEKAPAVLAEADRHVPGGRAVQLTLRQTQIETSIDIGRVATYNYAYDWSFFFDDVDEDMVDMLHKSQRDKAEATAVPLRAALAGFDIDALAVAATGAGLARLDWFQPQPIMVNKDPVGENRAAFLASSDASQFALIWYRYELSPDFSQIRVIGEITLMRKRRAGDTRSEPLTPIYRQRLLSAVQLRKRSYEPRENVASWSGENGMLGMAALAAAFGRFEQLLPYALGLGQKDIDSLSDKRHEKAFAGGFYGSLIARSPSDPDDVLIWTKGLVQVQSVP
jgi:hypothetical protein